MWLLILVWLIILGVTWAIYRTPASVGPGTADPEAPDETYLW